MSEMIERVARAICGIHNNNAEHVFQHMRECYMKEAKAAIAAMREPTDAISNLSTSSIYYSAEEIWKMMIDEALKES